jgi:hypothetical protein
MGEVRGAGARDHKGGAPTKTAIHQLVMHLASTLSTSIIRLAETKVAS